MHFEVILKSIWESFDLQWHPFGMDLGSFRGQFREKSRYFQNYGNFPEKYGKISGFCFIFGQTGVLENRVLTTPLEMKMVPNGGVPGPSPGPMFN